MKSYFFLFMTVAFFQFGDQSAKAAGGEERVKLEDLHKIVKNSGKIGDCEFLFIPILGKTKQKIGTRIGLKNSVSGRTKSIEFFEGICSEEDHSAHTDSDRPRLFFDPITTIGGPGNKGDDRKIGHFDLQQTLEKDGAILGSNGKVLELKLYRDLSTGKIVGGFIFETDSSRKVVDVVECGDTGNAVSYLKNSPPKSETRVSSQQEIEVVVPAQ